VVRRAARRRLGTMPSRRKQQKPRHVDAEEGDDVETRPALEDDDDDPSKFSSTFASRIGRLNLSSTDGGVKLVAYSHWSFARSDAVFVNIQPRQFRDFLRP